MSLSLIDDRWLIVADRLPKDQPFTIAFAVRMGVSRYALHRLVELGLLRQPIKGVYVSSSLEDSTWLRCMCLRLAIPGDCVVVDRHAAWLHGASMALAPGEHRELQPISVFRPSGSGRTRLPLTLSGERNLVPSDITEVHGLAVTTKLRTAWDLGRTRFPEPALAGIDQMLRAGVDKQELLDGIERFKGMRWVTTLRAVGPLGDHRAESPPESVLRLRWIQAGRPHPVPQLEVYDGGRFVALLDLGLPQIKYGAEYYGVDWHSSDDQMEHDLKRLAALRRLGWIIDVFTADDVFGRSMHAEFMIARRLRELG